MFHRLQPRLILSAGCFLALSPLSALAQWQVDGVPVFTQQTSGHSTIPDGAGGAIVTWGGYSSPSSSSLFDIYAQRINAAGVAQWTAGGVTMCAAPGHQRGVTIVADGAGGAIIAWQDYRAYPSGDLGPNVDIYAQRVNADGVPQWATDGVPVCTAANLQTTFQSVSDGAGGAIGTWHDYRNGNNADIYAQRLDAAGVPLWTPDGVALCTAVGNQIDPDLALDGAGGVLVAWHDYRSGSQNSDIYAQRVDAGGVAQWTSDGVALCTAAGRQEHARIVSDGAGGAIVSWQDTRNLLTLLSDIYAQRVNAEGAPQWVIDGIAVCSEPGDQGTYARSVSDGAGGAISIWSDTRTGTNSDLYAQRLNAGGVPQWTAGGVAVCTVAATTSRQPTIDSDGFGGALMSWADDRNGSDTDIYAQRVSAEGVPHWTVDGVAVCTNPRRQEGTLIVTDGTGGGILTWSDYRDISTNYTQIYAQRVYGGGGVAAVSPGRVEQFAMRAPHPNPAHAGTSISFDLVTTQRVSVSVYNVSGQLVRALAAKREFPAGSQNLVWDGTSDAGTPASAGVYFIRVMAGDASVARRVAILR